MNCKYCKTKIHAFTVRCENCDYAWQDGFKAGKQDIRSRLKEVVTHLFNLAGLEFKAKP